MRAPLNSSERLWTQVKAYLKMVRGGGLGETPLLLFYWKGGLFLQDQPYHFNQGCQRERGWHWRLTGNGRRGGDKRVQQHCSLKKAHQMHCPASSDWHSRKESDWIKRQRIYFCCAPHLHGQHGTWVCMIRRIRSSFAKTWKVNRLHAVSFALSALISHEGNPVSAYTCHWCQPGHFLLLLSSRSRNLPVDLFIICCETQFGYQRRTLYISTGKPDFGFLNICKLHSIYFLWGPSIPATWDSFHHDWVICKYISFIICFHTLTASPESNVRFSLFLQIPSPLCVLLLCSGMCNIYCHFIKYTYIYC